MDGNFGHQMGQNMTKPMIEGMAGVMMSSDTQDLWPVATTLLRISTLNCRILIMITAVRWMSYLKLHGWVVCHTMLTMVEVDTSPGR